MANIKLFEAFNLDSMINKCDDVAVYLSQYTHVGGIESKWCLPNFDLKRILNDDQYKEYRGNDKSRYIRYYICGFYYLTSVYKAQSEMSHRAKIHGLKYFFINTQQENRECKMVFFTKEDWEKLDLEGVVKSFNKVYYDVLFEEDIQINPDEFEIIYDDEDIMAVKPKTYKAAIKYSADTSWATGLKKNEDWIKDQLKRGSYYGGFNWYKSKSITKEIESWWRRLLHLPKKQVQQEIKEFSQDFPRFLFYIVIFKKFPREYKYSSLQLCYDISRAEYGEDPLPFSSQRVMFGGYWGDRLDAAHNQLKIMNNKGRVTLKEVFKEHGHLFNRAFREIEADFNREKEELYDTLGIWADKGGEYKDDALVFLRSSNEPERLQIARKKDVKVSGDVTRWTRLGYYDDPKFNWWDKEQEPEEREIPKNKYKDFFQSIEDNVKKLRDAIDAGFKL